MTNFELIADRIINAEGVSFAIACGIGHMLDERVEQRREALKRAIVDALADVFADAVKATHEIYRGGDA
jgi:hypothetical protein